MDTQSSLAQLNAKLLALNYQNLNSEMKSGGLAYGIDVDSDAFATTIKNIVGIDDNQSTNISASNEYSNSDNSACSSDKQMHLTNLFNRSKELFLAAFLKRNVADRLAQPIDDQQQSHQPNELTVSTKENGPESNQPNNSTKTNDMDILPPIESPSSTKTTRSSLSPSLSMLLKQSQVI